MKFLITFAFAFACGYYVKECRDAALDFSNIHIIGPEQKAPAGKHSSSEPTHTDTQKGEWM